MKGLPWFQCGSGEAGLKELWSFRSQGVGTKFHMEYGKMRTRPQGDDWKQGERELSP